MRWGGQLVGVATVILFVVTFFYFVFFAAIGMVAAAFMMVAGVLQSLRANKTGEVPQVTNKCLYTVFYVIAVPVNIMLGGLASLGGEDVSWHAALGYNIFVMFTAYIALRHLILPKIMRRSSLAIHTHTAWILAILLWPCYAVPLHKLGVSMIFYRLGDSFLGWLSP